MKHAREAIVVLSMACVIAAVALASCRLPPPGTVGRKVIDCSVDAVRTQAVALIAPVNSCLSGASVRECLLGLVNPAAGVTYNVIACVVRRQGADWAAAEAINPKDVEAKIRAGNAREFIIAEQIEFSDGP